jgi:hypothetical protein
MTEPSLARDDEWRQRQAELDAQGIIQGMAQARQRAVELAHTGRWRGGNARFAASAALPVGDLGRVVAEHDLWKPSRATRTRRPATGVDGAHPQVGHRPCVAERPLSPAKRLPPARKDCSVTGTHGTD